MSGIRLPRHAQLWLPGYLRARMRQWRDASPDGTVDVMLSIADHYEPDHGGASLPVQQRRVERWLRDYPRLADSFHDADGRPPQHTFFYPLEVYRADQVAGLVELCGAGYGEVEIHLHHAHDTSANLRRRLLGFRDLLASRYGLLGRDQAGHPQYAFVHGNWALDNGRGDSRWCGVNDELNVLRETGCYADFTMPAAPDPAQSRTVNSIYYAVDDPLRPRSYDYGTAVQVGQAAPANSLMMLQGPFCLDWLHRVRGILPRIESAGIDTTRWRQPTLARFRRWVDAGVSVAGRPEWIFVKLHTHGAKEGNADVLLGPAMYEFHRAIGEHFNDGKKYRLHYVTAREAYNIVKAAEAGERGNAGQFRDYALTRPPVTVASPLNYANV